MRAVIWYVSGFGISCMQISLIGICTSYGSFYLNRGPMAV